MTVYWDIFETDATVEFHCSRDKEAVINRECMSRRIAKDHPDRDEIVRGWVLNQILPYGDGLKRVHTS